MLVLRRTSLAVGVGTALGLSACTALYPRFDNFLLNPDIAFPSAGEVVQSVKCAVSGYLIERSTQISSEAQNLLLAELEDKHRTNVVSTYCPIASDNNQWVARDHPPSHSDWYIAFPEPDERDPGRCELREDSHPIRINQGKGASNSGIFTRIWTKQLRCDQPYHIYNRVRLTKRQATPGNSKKYSCQPNGGCLPGTLPHKSGTCAVDDASRFGLDPSSNAKIELSLSAVNQVSMNYQRIDAEKLDFLTSIIVPGDGAKSFPFPSLKASSKATNRVQLTILLPQAMLKADETPAEIVKLARRIDEMLLKLRSQGPGAKIARERSEDITSRVTVDRTDRLARATLKQITDDAPNYKSTCEETGRVDFLALKSYLTRIVADQEAHVYSGAPEVALDTLVLTSEFQIFFDATAGTRIFRILPVLIPPVLALNPDHTHNLKITFDGGKTRALSTNGVSLVQRCIARLRNTGTAQDPQVVCRTPESIQREGLIQAVETKPSSTN